MQINGSMEAVTCTSQAVSLTFIGMKWNPCRHFLRNEIVLDSCIGMVRTVLVNTAWFLLPAFEDAVQGAPAAKHL